jgi:hypothetical protein
MAHLLSITNPNLQTSSIWTAFARRARGAGVLLWLSATLPPLAAQAPVTFEGGTDVREVMVGTSFEVSFALRNAQTRQFTPPKFQDFSVVGGPSESRGTTFINGRSSTHQSWAYELEARRVGTFTIGTATVVVDGRTLTSKPFTIKVVAAASSKGGANPPPGAGDEVFAVGEMSSPEAYPGQQVTWRAKLYTRVNVEGADIIAWPDFEGFYSKEKRRFDARISYETLRGKKYAVKILHEEAIFPQGIGTPKVGAASIRVGIEQPGAQGFLFGPKPLNLQTQALSLRVKPLPEPPPAEFTGGVGAYSWEILADSARALTTDDAFTLKIVVKGNGDARRFAAPKIAVPPGCEIFEPRVLDEEEYENEREIVHTKTFEYVVLPKEPGIHTFSPTTCYFDPDSNRYCYLRAASPIQLAVTAGQNYQAAQEAVDAAPAPPTVRSPQIWERVGEALQSPILWGAVSLPLVALGIFALWRRRKTPPAASPNPAPRAPDTTKQARQRLASATKLLHAGEPRAFYDELLKSLQAYLAARLALSPAQMNQSTVRAQLAARKVPAIRIQALLSVWQTCEQAIFAGQAQAEQMESTWRTAETLVQELEREL